MRTVLVVDDEPLVRLTLRSTIPWQRWGFGTALEASNGEEALAALETHPEIALVFLDLVMPRMDGLELLRRIGGRPNRPQVIVLTAHDDFARVREAFQLGAADYLLKSELEPDRLESVLQKAAARLDRFGAATGASGHAVALKQETLRRLLATDEPGRLEADLGERGIHLGRAIRLGLLGIRDFDVVAARYDSDRASAFPLGLMAAVEQVLERHGPAEVLHVEDDTYVLFLFSSSGESVEPSRVGRLQEDIVKALWSYLNVRADLSWSPSTPVADGPGPAALYRALQAGRTRPSRIVERARERILAGFSDPELHLGKLAADLGVTPNHLSGLFTRETGRSFRAYLAYVRVEAAKRLLAGSGLKVWEVAERVGYMNIEHFSRVFKKQTGVAPHLFTKSTGRSP